tara:strand:+ start:24026 stop:24715 length:690 start_codon:yes stop_codon:yes gene_type:complete
MEEAVIIAVFFALMISLTEYVSKMLNLKRKSYYNNIISFTAGVSITYILLEFLPVFAERAFSVNKALFLALLVGFISHHVVEKEIYQHNKRHELIKKLSLEENIFYYIYHMILGIVLVALMQRNIPEGIFFVTSIFAFTIASNLPASPHKSKWRMLVLSTSTVTGAIIASIIGMQIPNWLEVSLIGLVAGVLLFTVTRHHIPYRRKGNIAFFVLGFFIYGMLIAIKWLI